MNKEKNDFDVMKEMSKRNMDIRAATDVISIDKHKLGGTIKIGLDKNTFEKIIASYGTGDGKYACVLYIVDMDQFDAVKSE